MLKTVGFPSTRTGDQTIVDGNLVIGTAGKGVDFSAASHATGMTSELLDDYEEGTWTPAVNTGTVVATDATYTKIGNTVRVCAVLSSFSDRTTATTLILTGLPFTPARAQAAGPATGRFLAKLINTAYISAPSYGTFYATSTGAYSTLQHSDLSASASASILFSAVYETT